MNSKIIVATLALFCLIEGYNSQIISNVIDNITSLISSVIGNVGAVIQIGTGLVDAARNIVNSLVDQAVTSIQHRLDQLGDLVSQVTSQAQLENVNITQCLKIVDDALSTVDLSGLKSCANSDKLDLLGVNLGNLGNLKVSLSNSLANCLLTNLLNLDGLSSCVQVDIDNAQSQSSVVQDEVNAGTEDAKKNATECVNVNLGGLNNIVDNITTDLQNCVKGIL